MRRRWLLLFLLLTVCRLPPPASAIELGSVAPITLMDDAGRSVTVATLPQRIISLAPSVTELLFALGAADQIVAVTQACNYPPAALSKTRLGFANSAVEQMIMLEPDLVIGIVGMVKPLTIETLERQRIPLLLLEAKTLGDITRHIRWIGRATGRLVEADRLITHLEAEREALAAQLQGVEPLPVFYVVNGDPLMTVGPHTFIHQLFELAGGRNIAAAASGAYPQFSIEELLAADPAVIFFAGRQFAPLPDAQARVWRRWPMLRAVQQGRLMSVQSDLVDRPGPRIYEAAWQLAEQLHPERFAQAAGVSP